MEHPKRGTCSRRYSPQEKRALLLAYESARAAGETMDAFAARHGVSTASVCKWRKRAGAHGSSGLDPRPNPRNASGPHRGIHSYTPEQRRAAVEAFLAAGQTLKDFARLWGVSREVLARWVALYQAGGPKALEPKQRKDARTAAAGAAARSAGMLPSAGASSTGDSASGRASSAIVRPLAAPLHRLIAEIRQHAQSFGLRKIRDYLLRFHSVKVSTGSVRRSLVAQHLPLAQPPARKVRRAPPKPRRFERAKPMQLWQTDITSFVIGSHRERAYLCVFLDDCSRYVVSFALHLQQKSELVIEALKDGITRFGKPQEILTDQGRQYFSWRGKSEFQQLLHRQGIAHVVARSHHPQTVGKCERLWETLKRELLDRVTLKDLGDARERVQHYFAHYNFFRPHQGIDGVVPADRFFAAQDALRQTIQAQICKQELALALGETPRAPVYLFGQIGEQKVALHGERGRLVVQTEDGLQRELSLDELGARALPAVPAVQTDRETAATSVLAEHAGEKHDVARNEDSHEERGDRCAAGQTASRDAERVEAHRIGAARAVGAAFSGGRDEREPVFAVAGTGGEEAAAPGRQAGPLPLPAAPAAAGAGSLDGGERGAEAGRAQELLGDARLLARQDG